MSHTLLVVDDDRNLLSLLRTYFAGLGWRVEACAEVGAALRLADSDLPYDALICDLHFSPAHLGEGFEIVSRARRRRPQSAVLLFTGAAVESVRDEALRLGADEVIAKPAPLAHLRDAALRGMKKA
ncbi:MAG TPA: response regulator [Vicinamibacteria bacterium]|nr:response regulator [Vicinamibacteria bacterium]